MTIDVVSSTTVVDYFIYECGACPTCAALLLVIDDDDNSDKEDKAACSSSFVGRDSCTICLGLLASSTYIRDKVLPRVVESLRPYLNNGEDGGQKSNNQLSREAPTVNLSWLSAVRAQCAINSARQNFLNDDGQVHYRDAMEVHRLLKERLRGIVRSRIISSLHQSSDDNYCKDDSRYYDEGEAGYLGVHILCLPLLPSHNTQLCEVMPNDESDETIVAIPSIPPSLLSYMKKNINELSRNHQRTLNPRCRFRGNDPTSKQGGDPRINLELRIRRSLADSRLKWADKKVNINGNKGDANNDNDNNKKKKRQRSSQHGIVESVEPSSIDTDDHIHELILWLEKDTIVQWIANGGGGSLEDTHWLHQWRHLGGRGGGGEECGVVHVTAWRKPFYIMGSYTKSRRDISQTPFYVPSSTISSSDGTNGAPPPRRNCMVRLGVSSVEEIICPILAQVGCGGISLLNNEHLPTDDDDDDNYNDQQKDDNNNTDDQKGEIVYGMCKFHASGREDMDVRMLLPPTCARSSNVVITGRPFVCEIIDAHKMPSELDLQRVVDGINCDSNNNCIQDMCGDTTVVDEIIWDEKGWPTISASPDRYHGTNPLGVGVSSPLTLVPASAFSTLQSQTEEKVKCYGCVCWTSIPILSDIDLIQRLKCMPWDTTNENTTANNSWIIKQKTPLRVLHRRSSEIRIRHILTLSACRINDHWFRLRMSTSAGTYVKEFVHGDCGRTRPSISSLLGGARIDITELDCEGIIC